jgi:hypothetical protein
VAAWLQHVSNALDAAPRLAATERSLGSYTLLPHHRTGAAAAHHTAFRVGLPARGVIDVVIPLKDGTGATQDAAGRVALRGPGDVVGIDQRQVVRRYPAPGTRDAEPSDLAHCELDLPDLPWMFTPAGPSGGADGVPSGALPPWLRLVVVPDRPGLVQPAERPGLPPAATVEIAELPQPADAWAWAHVQVIGAPDGPGATVEQRLSPNNADLNVARLLCPRRLEENRSWVAMLVPTFEVGRCAGLDEPTEVSDLRWSWGSSGATTVTLPVYDHWTFSTGADGDFESLARRIRPVSPPAGTGRRLVDMTNPGLGIDVAAAPGARPVHGALTHPNPAPAEDTASAVPPAGTAGTWDEPSTATLRSRVEDPDRVQFDGVRFDPAEPDPEVTPSLYGGTHRATGVVPAAGAEPAWLRQLNLDPAHRVAAGLGAAVARMDQEELMTSAWAQLPAVLDANAALRAAQLARFVGDRLHARHVARLDPGSLVAVTSRSHARLLTEPGVTARAVVGASATPTAAAASTLRMLARPHGPLRRFADERGGGADGSGALLADGVEGRDWCWRYSPPDGARGLGEAGRALLAELRGADADSLAAALGEPSVLDVLTDAGAGAGAPTDPQAVAGLALSRLLEVLLAALPTVDELEAPEPGEELDRAALERAAEIVTQAFGVLQGQEEWWLPLRLAERHRLSGGEVAHAPGHVAVPRQVVQDEVLERLWDLLGREGLADRERFDEHTASVVNRLVEVISAELERLSEQLEAVYDDAFIDTGDLREPARAPLRIPTLRLPELLEPRVTVGRRVRERIPGIAEHFPGWLDNDRFDPVMAAPRFTHPMYEALHRYDPEWLLPGVAAISPHEMMTVLATNPVFVEGFLIGLNHEFMRELVWRGYPTDGRGTSFRSFWTPTDELTQPVHRLDDGDLGTHLSATASGRLVVLVRGELVRRYPHLLGHAVQQKGDDDPISYEDQPADTLFQVQVGPDLLLTGIDLTPEAALARDVPGVDGRLPPVPRAGAWWFTLSEHVGEPRFGLDEPPEGAPQAWSGKRDDLRWGDWPLLGQHLAVGGAPTAVERPPPRTSADLGWLLFQLPARAGYRLGRMLRPETMPEPTWP